MATDDLQFQYSLEVLRQSASRERDLATTRYAPWPLAASVSAAIGLSVGSVVGVYLWLGFWPAGLVCLVALPLPVMVGRWAWRAYGVELFRLQQERRAYEPLAAVDQLVSEPESEPVELNPGWELDGVIVAREAEPNPAAVELRDCCLRFVRAGMRRGGWSRSKLAEGPGKLMAGPDWDRASVELQRLHYFSGSPLKPARDLGDILKRLELAR